MGFFVVFFSSPSFLGWEDTRTREHTHLPVRNIQVKLIPERQREKEGVKFVEASFVWLLCF